MLFTRHFSIEEANRLVPKVQRVFARVRAMLLEETGEEIAIPPPSAPGRAKINGHGPQPATVVGLETPGRARRVDEANRQLQTLLDEGIVVQDVSRGLIDFPTIDEKSGEEVLLCYELRDGDAIVAYHGVHAGYSGRIPVERLA